MNNLEKSNFYYKMYFSTSPHKTW